MGERCNLGRGEREEGEKQRYRDDSEAIGPISGSKWRRFGGFVELCYILLCKFEFLLYFDDAFFDYV